MPYHMPIFCGHHSVAVGVVRSGLSLATTKRQITQMMSKDLLNVAIGYDVDGETPTAPREALASELEARLLPLGSGLLRLRLLVDALGTLEGILPV